MYCACELENWAIDPSTPLLLAPSPGCGVPCLCWSVASCGSAHLVVSHRYTRLTRGARPRRTAGIAHALCTCYDGYQWGTGLVSDASRIMYVKEKEGNAEFGGAKKASGGDERRKSVTVLNIRTEGQHKQTAIRIPKSKNASGTIKSPRDGRA